MSKTNLKQLFNWIIKVYINFFNNKVFYLHFLPMNIIARITASAIRALPIITKIIIKLLVDAFVSIFWSPLTTQKYNTAHTTLLEAFHLHIYAQQQWHMAMQLFTPKSAQSFINKLSIFFLLLKFRLLTCHNMFTNPSVHIPCSSIFTAQILIVKTQTQNTKHNSEKCTIHFLPYSSKFLNQNCQAAVPPPHCCSPISY